MNNFNDNLNEKKKLIDEELNRIVHEKHVPYNDLFKAARYSLLASGKRLRPILSLIVTEIFMGQIDKTLIPAVALEMIHTYSLIHDDLPCIDNDDLRRGRLTLHKVFPESYAVLAGDFLLTSSFEVISTSNKLSLYEKNSLITTLAKRAGGDGMIAGQIVDLSSEGKKLDLKSLQQLHINKTGSLFIAACEIGGILSHASAGEMKLLQSFGKLFGLAFQIMDDILDVVSSSKKLGKTVGSDAAKSKLTYPSLVGLEESYELLQSVYDSAFYVLSQFSKNVSVLKYIMKKCLGKNNFVAL
jgi:geranylgeranyl diphosphate synthase, type II